MRDSIVVRGTMPWNYDRTNPFLQSRIMPRTWSAIKGNPKDSDTMNVKSESHTNSLQ